MKNSILFVAFILSGYLFSQNNIDVKHYSLHLNLDPRQKTVVLEELIEIQLLNDALQIELDLIGLDKDGSGMEVTSVTILKKAIKWRQLPDRLVLDIPKKYSNQTISLLIKMHGQPQDGLVISKNRYGAPTIFADNWPNRARYWYACHDHPSDKATYTFDVYAPQSYAVVANGTLVFDTPQKEKNGLTWWCYMIDEPIATKVAVIGVADFNSKEIGKVDGIPIFATVYPQDSLGGMASFEVAPQILNFYQKTIAPYPFLQLNNVQSTTRYGGMENVGCIFYDEESLTQNRRSTLLIAHEIAHQWFGNTVTESDWQHLWLSEGFATYLTNYYIEMTEGQAPFREQLVQDRNRVINFSKKFQAALVDSLTTDLNDRLNPNAYQKGSWVLHMLRVELGDSTFWSGIQSFYESYKYKNASSEDFCKSMLSGVKDANTIARLETFFYEWLYQVGHPQLKATLETKNGQQYLNLTQIQKPLFTFPLKVAFYDENNNAVLLRYQITAKENSFALPQTLNHKKLRFELDPFTELLFELK
ncbi:MAG: M1 family metallopeptidase [Flavobacteriales bacterium]